MNQKLNACHSDAALWAEVEPSCGCERSRNPQSLPY